MARFALMDGRRRGVLVAVAAILVLIPALGSGVEKFSSLSIDPMHAITALLEGRSPGERTDANLTSTKKVIEPRTAARMLGRRDSESASGRVFPPNVSYQAPRPEDFLDVVVPLTSIGESQVHPSQLSPTGELLDVAFGGGRQSYPGYRFGGGYDGGGDDGGSDDGGSVGADPELNPTSQIPAVPEPETWALMLLGMALCGASMRRKRRQRLVGA